MQRFATMLWCVVVLLVALLIALALYLDRRTS
jgi:hypothetical protein